MDNFISTQLKADCRLYVHAVMRHWWAIVIGAVAGILGLITLVAGDLPIPRWGWWVLFGMGVSLAQFLAWRDMRQDRDKISDERDALKRFNLTQDTLATAARYRADLITMQNEAVKNETDLGGWIQRYKSLRAEIISFLAENVTPAESRLFERLGLFPILEIPDQPALDHKHLKWRSMVIRDYHWLEKLTADYGRQRFRPEIEGGVEAPSSTLGRTDD